MEKCIPNYAYPNNIDVTEEQLETGMKMSFLVNQLFALISGFVRD